MNGFAEIVTERLEQKGLEPAEIKGFVRCVAVTISDDNNIALEELNRRLGSLGWDTVDLDYHTLQLIMASVWAVKERGQRSEIRGQRIRNGAQITLLAKAQASPISSPLKHYFRLPLRGCQLAPC